MPRDRISGASAPETASDRLAGDRDQARRGAAMLTAGGVRAAGCMARPRRRTKGTVPSLTTGGTRPGEAAPQIPSSHERR